MIQNSNQAKQVAPQSDDTYGRRDFLTGEKHFFNAFDINERNRVPFPFDRFLG
jgi:hypothetical protein